MKRIRDKSFCYERLINIHPFKLPFVIKVFNLTNMMLLYKVSNILCSSLRLDCKYIHYSTVGHSSMECVLQLCPNQIKFA